MRTPSLLAIGALCCASSIASAQDAAIIYRLGRDTVAVEQFSRTPAKFTGEMVTRSGAAVIRTQYDIALGANGRPTAATIRRRQADGAPIPNNPTEYRFTFRADSTKRDVVWPDSTQSRTIAAGNAFPAMPVFAYAPFELIYAYGPGARDSVVAVATGGNGAAVIGLQPYATDTLRIRGGAYQMLMHFDKQGRLQSTDGSMTTNKSIGTRINGRVDIAKLASTMKPTGVLSPRATAYAGFQQGPIFINYGRPAVRERSVWGGTLVPFDSIWRTGANEATHLATSKTIVLGDMTLAPGLYTLWIQHTHSGTFLIVNKQVGQWGTVYQPGQDIGRMQMDFAPLAENIEDFTITIRATGPTAGAIDFAWGKAMATAKFTLRS